MTDSATLAPPQLVLDGVDSVHQHLRGLILRGQMQAGVPMSQVQLAQQLGVSRTPLREALRMLQNEGLVAGEMNRRVYIPPLSLPELDELYALRITVETLAVRLSVPHLTAADLGELQSHLDTMSAALQADDLAGYEAGEAAHSAFHLGLVAHGGERLGREVQQLHDHTDRYRYTYTAGRLTTPRDSRHEHQGLLDAAAAKDAAQTAKLLARHYASTVIGLIALLEPAFEPVATRTALRTVTDG